MLRSFYIPHLLPLRQKAQNTRRPVRRVTVVPDPGPLNNNIRLARYRCKKKILALNPKAVFPLEIYRQGQRP